MGCTELWMIHCDHSSRPQALFNARTRVAADSVLRTSCAQFTGTRVCEIAVFNNSLQRVKGIMSNCYLKRSSSVHDLCDSFLSLL